MDFEQFKTWAYEDARDLIAFLKDENVQLKQMLRDKEECIKGG